MMRKPSHRPLASPIVLALLLTAASAAAATEPFELVPEMETPPDLLVQPRSERATLQDHPEARRGLDQLRARVAVLWPRLRDVDWVELSRFHREFTRDWSLPAEPGTLDGQVMAHDEATGRFTLELRGPRLPARFDVVHRYVHVYASYQPASGTLDQLVVTIRGWVLE